MQNSSHLSEKKGAPDMSLSRVQFLLPGLAIMLWISPAQAGFDYLPPTGKQTAPVTVPEVEAQPLEEPKPAAAPAAETPVTPAQAATQATTPPSEEPVLKIKTVTPVTDDLSVPPSDMDMPQNPGLNGDKPKPALATVSVPPIATDAPLKAPSPPAAVVEAPKPAPVPATTASIVPPPVEKKKSGLSINPYPLKDGVKTPVQSANAPLSPRPQAAPRAADPQGEYAIVEGFGSDIALALALREVVPAHYSFSFAKGVNPGYRVSWNGGKPWNQVVREMVAPLDLTYEIRGNTVVIRPAAAQDVQPLPGKRAEAVPMAPPSEESNIETASGEESAAKVIEQAREDSKEEKPLKKPETIQLSNADAAKNGVTQPRIWEAKQGASLKETLDQWSEEADVALVWKAAHDYKIDSGVLVSGSFENAVKVLFMHGLDPANAPRHSRAADSLLIEDQTS
jgi:hypothetical protein